MKLHIQVIEQGGRWYAFVPAVPGVEVAGDTQQEAIEMAAALAVSRLASWRSLSKADHASN